MDTEDREHQIKSIIKLEDRIVGCQRCPELIRCTSQPSRGRGDLEPAVLLVFEFTNQQNSNNQWIIELRNTIQKYFQIARVYHTFLVRCHPKSCISNQESNCCGAGKLIDRNGICLLTRQNCDGIPIKPSNQEIINCLYFILEEITILNPQYVILFGSRVKDFILKTYGIFDADDKQQVYKYDTITFLSTTEDNLYKAEDIRKLAMLAASV